MSTVRSLAMLVLLAVLGAAGTLAVAAAMGMAEGDLRTIAGSLVPATILTVVAVAASRAVLARASIRQRFLVVAAVGTLVALGNVAALTIAMSVSPHDASLLSALLLYAVAVGIGAALVVARSSIVALDRLAEVTGSLGRGELDARVGPLAAGPELDGLAAAVDAMAAELEAARERERRVDATRRDLISAVSHDLRTPLASLRAMTEAINDGVVDDPPTMRRYAAEINRSVGQLSSMVDDLFELAQLDAGAIEAETERVRLRDVVASAVAAVEPHAGAKGLHLSADLGDAAAVACSPRLARVLQTLLVNAVRHTPADGTVHVEAHASPDRLSFAVQDTGEGIAPEDLERVFEPFFRGDAARSGPGAGLGLALAKRIVEALGGAIAATSEPAAGSRFEVVLPLP